MQNRGGEERRRRIRRASESTELCVTSLGLHCFISNSSSCPGWVPPPCWQDITSVPLQLSFLGECRATAFSLFSCVPCEIRNTSYIKLLVVVKVGILHCLSLFFQVFLRIGYGCSLTQSALASSCQTGTRRSTLGTEDWQFLERPNWRIGQNQGPKGCFPTSRMLCACVASVGAQSWLWVPLASRLEDPSHKPVARWLESVRECRERQIIGCLQKGRTVGGLRQTNLTG